MEEDTKFWDGWHSALDGLDTRLQVLQGEIKDYRSAQDLLLDVQNEIKELRDITNGQLITNPK